MDLGVESTIPNAPGPNPMTWAVEPFAASPTAISMTASIATQQDCPSVSYYFKLTGNPTGGSGGADSGWQAGTAYINNGLEPNNRYGYLVTAASCFPAYQETGPSNTVY